VIVVVVIPFTVVETSLTTVLDEPPLPPEPELPPADCEDEVADVDVDDVDEVADVDDVADADDFAAVDGVAVAAAEDEAIALVDMKTSSEGDLGRRHVSACSFPSTRIAPKSGVRSATKLSVRAIGSSLVAAARTAAAGCSVLHVAQYFT
jgi:hypothetical protein